MSVPARSTRGHWRERIVRKGWIESALEHHQATWVGAHKIRVCSPPAHCVWESAAQPEQYRRCLAADSSPVARECSLHDNGIWRPLWSSSGYGDAAFLPNLSRLWLGCLLIKGGLYGAGAVHRLRRSGCCVAVARTSTPGAARRGVVARALVFQPAVLQTLFKRPARKKLRQVFTFWGSSSAAQLLPEKILSQHIFGLLEFGQYFVTQFRRGHREPSFGAGLQISSAAMARDRVRTRQDVLLGARSRDGPACVQQLKACEAFDHHFIGLAGGQAQQHQPVGCAFVEVENSSSCLFDIGRVSKLLGRIARPPFWWKHIGRR